MSKIVWTDAPPGVVWSRLRSLRQNRGLSQIRVAVGAGLSLSMVQLVEKGIIEPSPKVRRKLTTFFNVDAEDIFPCLMVDNKPYRPPSLSSDSSPAVKSKHLAPEAGK